MRGKREYEHSGRETNRITPADAGKTSVNVQLRVTRADHPRGCGENELAFGFRRDNWGSPPRMRGKLKLAVGTHNGQRITPADAGKTQSATADNIVREDHPRGCGENVLFPSNVVNQPGITPADAGKT